MEKNENSYWYKYDNDGGYLIKTDKYSGQYYISDSEFEKIRTENEKIKEIFELKKEYLKTLRSENKDIVQYLLKKIKYERNYSK
jgi:hypothetical protein